MCEFVGVDFDTINFKDEDWYLQQSWTAEQEEEFRLWMIGYLKRNKKARVVLYGNSVLNLEKQVNSFIFNYGWKKDNE